jgi:hypothetical protein
MAPPGIPTVSMVRTTIPSTGTTSSTPFHFSFSFLFWLILDAWGEPGRLWILAFIARSDAPSHARNATPLHSSRLEAREHSRREGGDPIPSRAELPRRPRRTCSRSLSSSAVRLCLWLWTPLPLSHGERGEPLVRVSEVRCGGAR